MTNAAVGYRGYPNQVQLGINDTLLTSALIKGEFKTAEKIIIENTEEGFLDEGPFERIPLALVLSGDAEFRSCPRHLRLAKLLVERGANTNLRIPLAEWQGASPSPMEYLADLFMRVKDLIKFGEVETDEDLAKGPLYTIGLHDEENLGAHEIKEQLIELLDIFLACGGNPNVTTTSSNSTLYHFVLSDPEPDASFVMRLCEAGGDLNQTNVHGTTPLMDIVTYTDSDLALELLSRILEKRPDISSLDAQNCSNETTLWRAMFSGSPQVAIKLLARGADPTPRATVASGKWHKGKKYIHSYARETIKSGLSAMFASLLQNSGAYMHFASVDTSVSSHLQEITAFDFDINLFNKVMSYALYPVIDSAYFSDCFPDKIVCELETIMGSETKFALQEIVPQGMKIDDVPRLMFGNLKAGLQQLCVRKILHSVLFGKSPRNSKEFIRKLKKLPELDKKFYEQEENWDEDSSVDFDKEFRKEFARKFEEVVDQWEVVQDLTGPAIQCLVQEHLKLPSQFTPCFQIEAASLQLGSCLYTLESIDCLQGCEGESDASTDNLFEDDVDDDDDYDDDNDDDDDESSWGAGLDAFDYSLDWKDVIDACADADNEDMDVSSSESSGDDLNIPTEDMIFSKYTLDAESGDSSNGSGERIPEDICRQEYETFSNDLLGDDTSPLSDMDVGDQESPK